MEGETQSGVTLLETALADHQEAASQPNSRAVRWFYILSSAVQINTEVSIPICWMSEPFKFLYYCLDYKRSLQALFFFSFQDNTKSYYGSLYAHFIGEKTEPKSIGDLFEVTMLIINQATITHIIYYQKYSVQNTCRETII